MQKGVSHKNMACVFFCPERKWGSMAQIFRVERTKNFTVMSNHHFNQSSVEAVEQAKKKQEEAEKQARQAEYQIEREKNRADMEIQRARRKAKSEIADMKENQFFWDWGYLCVIFFSFLQNGAFQQDVLQLIMIPINWCKEYIAWFERLEYISDTAGEMLFKGFFSMLMITAGILGCVFLVWAGVEQYKKIWDDLYKMVLISSISFVAVLGNLIREYLPLNLILVILFINIGTILLRAYLKKKYPQMYWLERCPYDNRKKSKHTYQQNTIS